MTYLNTLLNARSTHIECCTCGIVFAVPENWRAKKQETGTYFFCPNGHCQCYSESDVVRAKKLLEEEMKRHMITLTRFNEAERAKQDITKELIRIKKRISAGVCPCCNRTFQQLARHMKTKHPEQAGRIFK
jgi:NMD protein affecting ribosome stability and mRNA decay